MGIEIERKFLVRGNAWRAHVQHSEPMRQGYLGSSDRVSIRIRVAGQDAHLNLKSATLGVQRLEYDYPIPVGDAEEILTRLCNPPLLEKTRHHVTVAGHAWEVDEFHGDNRGLVVAELELSHPDEPFQAPDWLGREVSEEPRYYNVVLVREPFSRWPDRDAIRAEITSLP